MKDSLKLADQDHLSTFGHRHSRPRAAENERVPVNFVFGGNHVTDATDSNQVEAIPSGGDGCVSEKRGEKVRELEGE